MMSKKHVPNQDKIKAKYHFSEKQKELIRLIRDENTKIVFLEGPSGTSKTFLSVYCALCLLYEKTVNGIQYIRSVEESGRKPFGILPGEMDDKFSPYKAPLIDKLEELLETYEYTSLLNKDKVIECVPVNFCRGRNWANQFIIFDEAQNTDFGEITTVLTRLAKNSKMIICGDTMQSDIKNSGFSQMIDLFDSEQSKNWGIHTFKFDKNDIVRSEVLKYIVDTIENGKSTITADKGTGFQLGGNSERGLDGVA